ncbi:putative solute/hydrogen antiporter [Gordonia hirsuta DSM 44140 = NBRC 16056]|uniref:Putative solute/hydrogen antiporter n=1 Tax=Gordonia hirsuta DSM 44140 = NBRC 16056 TaxID=1121927 RepID=L7LBK2_9ACTN|nr:cation:proton antiporter [Gordonia hirsuta]GAC57437.1 putative solute/hydrogen antiporter [Gordonia hirsuta DSM 44140 = NBRC 16056]
MSDVDAIEIAAIAVLCVLAIGGANTLAPRLRIAAPLLLVAVGVGVSLLPQVPEFHISPELILVGVLPPLLFAAARAMPVMDVKRDFQAIGALSILLVIISSLLLGVFFTLVLPDVSYALGVALGAILSPTDAVATGTIKRAGAPNRIVTVLSGESMFNDATALVLLRAAIAATAASISVFGVVINFVWAMAGAAVVGAVVGWLFNAVRNRIQAPAVATAVSFTAPYLAYLPAELIGTSGLVSAVAAGLISGRLAIRHLPATHRQSDLQNWRMVEVVLEGGVFLLMGLELYTLIDDVREARDTWLHAVWPAAAALALVLLIRLAFVGPLVWLLDRRTTRMIAREPEVAALRENLPSNPADDDTAGFRIRLRLDRRLADINYYRTETMGGPEAMVVVWGGLRGAVTLAAAQTLPTDTPHRSLLILIAFFVAAMSLGIQGGTIGWLLRRLPLPDQTADLRAEKGRLRGEMLDIVQRMLVDPEVIGDDSVLANQVKLVRDLETPDMDDGDPADPQESDALDMRLENARELRRVRRMVIDEQRRALLAFRDRGTYSSRALTAELHKLDAEEISLNV